MATKKAVSAKVLSKREMFVRGYIADHRPAAGAAHDAYRAAQAAYKATLAAHKADPTDETHDAHKEAEAAFLAAGPAMNRALKALKKQPERRAKRKR